MRRQLIVAVALLELSIPAAIAGDKGNKGRGNQGRQAGLTMLDDDIRRARDRDLERGRGRRNRDAVFGRRDRDDDRGAVRDPFFNDNGSIKHRGMDRNGDGIISRREWRGNDVSFDQHDRNGDGILSGDEVRPGAKRDRDRTRTIF
jgi:hypothetical protein